MEIVDRSREKLIISADDFGISQRANENILSLVRTGKLDRVSVLVNRKISSPQLTELAKANIKLDLHLDTPEVREGGCAFMRTVFFLCKYLTRRISHRKIAEKWEKQMEEFKLLFGRTPDGVNSHQYIHFFPPYFRLALALAAKHNIPYLRFGKAGILKSPGLTYRSLDFLWNKDVPFFREARLDSSDFLISFDWLKNFPLFLEKLPAGKTELIFHPERDEEFETMNKYFQK